MGELDEHAGERASPPGRSTPAKSPTRPPARSSPPISLSTTFAQDGVGGHKGFEYSRSGNPTRSALEAQVASLEQASHGLAFASGLAAEDNILRLLRQGQRTLLGNDAYGGTFRLISKVWSPLGFPWSAVDLTDLDALRRRLARRRRHGVARNADQPAAHLLRHRGDRLDRARTRSARRGRQHVRHALPAAAVDARCRHRRALVDQVPRRPQRRRRRLRRGERRRARRTAPVHPERGRRDPGAVRLLPRAARA